MDKTKHETSPAPNIYKATQENQQSIRLQVCVS